ncbi:MAG TPA: DUF58 domain-containing protein [Spongiibacteraceae bacterium]|nr:DUF58 domain-containing protein [Spongiibacteraceae bacterium]
MARPHWWQRRLDSWLTKRIPTARSVTLDQRRIFIFPSRAGLAFLLVLAVMLIAAINYQNNMAFALVFFLFSLFIVAILHTFSNLSGLRIEALRGYPTFAGESAEFEVRLGRTRERAHHAIELAWPGQPMAKLSLLDAQAATVKLFYRADRRGLLRPRRLLVQTYYPLGLLRAWTWIDLDIMALVYPRPLAGPRPLSEEGEVDSGNRVLKKGSDDFYGFRPYRSGDNLRHVLWRAYAKGQPLQAKQFAETYVQSHWLDYDACDGDREKRLSVLCYWVLESERKGDVFGLRLPGVTLEQDSGAEQRERALRQLALFQTPRVSSR